MSRLLTFALIVGNRGFFPDHLAKEGREAMIGVLEKAGIRVIALTPEQSKFGAVETPDEARRCAELFRKHRGEIDGILVTLPNFGEERGIATFRGDPREPARRGDVVGIARQGGAVGLERRRAPLELERLG